jgi:formylglycine-generating enzyme required for sulfatase activity
VALLAVALLITAAPAAQAQLVVEGTARLVDGTPAAGLRVEFLEHYELGREDRWYRFVAITDRDGHYVMNLDPVITAVLGPATGPAGPVGPVLYPNCPNPFNPTTILSYEVPQPGRVELAVFNVLGQPVRTWVWGEQQAGVHRVVWDGRDAAGQGVAAGVYISRLVTQGQVRCGKMMLLDGIAGAAAAKSPAAAAVPVAAPKTADGRSFAVRVVGQGCRPRVMANLSVDEAAQGTRLDIDGIEPVAATAGFAAGDADGTGRADDWIWFDRDANQTLVLRDPDRDGRVEGLEQIREYRALDGAVLTQRFGLIDAPGISRATLSLVLEHNQAGTQVLALTWRPPAGLLAALAPTAVSRVGTAAVAALLPEVGTLSASSARVLIPSGLTAGATVELAGAPSVVTYTPGQDYGWDFGYTPVYAVLSDTRAIITGRTLYVSAEAQVVGGLPVDATTLRLRVTGPAGAWELRPRIRLVDQSRDPGRREPVNRYAATVVWPVPAPGAYEASMAIVTPPGATAWQPGKVLALAAHPVRAPDSAFASPAAGRVLHAALPGGTTMEFVWVEPGTFAMGDDTAGRDVSFVTAGWGEHQVTLTRGFYLGRYEVTQTQWQAAMGTAPWKGRRYARMHGDDPATYLYFRDAQALVRALNRAAGDSLYRLPTEAEWEYACRAGTATQYSFGDDRQRLVDYAWCRANVVEAAGEAGSLIHPQPVGSRLPNPWGLYDMHGNAWEWVEDVFDNSYPLAPQVDPRGPLRPSASWYGPDPHVIRGGSFVWFSCESFYRSFEASDGRRFTRSDYWPEESGGVGVRLVRRH